MRLLIKWLEFAKSSRIAILIYFGFSVLLLNAEEYTADFLNIGVDAKALAMGEAYCAYSGDVSSFYWNPAGLGRIQNIRLSGMYGPQFGSIQNPVANFHYLGIVLPLQGDAVFAVNWIRLKVDDIPVYAELLGQSYWDRLHNIHLRPSGEPDGYMADTEDAFFFSFAKMNAFIWDLGWEFHEVRVEIPFGINVKWIHQSLGEGEATGLGIDLGTAIRMRMDDFFQYEPLGIFSVGMNIKDLTQSKLNWNTEEETQEQIKTRVRWGVAYMQSIDAVKGHWAVAIDFEKHRKNQKYLGFEACLYQSIFLRIGSSLGSPTYGAGISFWRLNVDYAFMTHELDNLHRISCSLDI